MADRSANGPIASLRIIHRIAAAEWRLGLLSGGFWALVATCGALAVFVCGEPDLMASVAAARLQQLTRGVLSFLFLVWWALAISRDVLSDAEEIILAKPVRSEWIALGKFLGNFALVVLAWCVTALIALAAQVVVGGTGLQIVPYAHALVRVLSGLFCFSSLVFAFGLLGRSPVAAAMVGLYWLFVLLATGFLGRVFTFYWSQNAGLFAGVGVSVLLLTLGAYQPRRRSMVLQAWLWGAVAVLVMVGSLAHGVGQVRRGHDPPLHEHPLAMAIASQYVKQDEPVSGFWVPGVNVTGAWGRLSAFEDHLLLIGLWSPEMVAGGWMLDSFQQIWETHRDQGVACIGIAISEEHRIARDFARERGWTFPVGVDTGTRETPVPADGSPVASAYDVGALPYAVLTDRRRRVVKIFYGWELDSAEVLEREIQALLERYPWSRGEESGP